MKLSDNSVKSLRELCLSELTPLYGEKEAEQLFFICMNELKGWKRYEISERKKEKLSDYEIDRFSEIIQRLKKNEPVQYIFGSAPFAGCVIKVDSSVLIPRPETEELVYLLKDKLKGQALKKIMDLCTGSGCIAISLKKFFPEAETEGADISPEALKIAQHNAQFNKTPVNFKQYDLLSFEPPDDCYFDLIVSNPPYIPLSEKATMHKNVLDFEPGIALFTQNNQAMIFYQAIIDKWSKTLVKNGILAFEINERGGDEVVELIKKSREFGLVECLKDLQGKDRFVLAVKN